MSTAPLALYSIELILSLCVPVEIIIQMDIIIREAEWRDKAGVGIITDFCLTANLSYYIFGCAFSPV